MRSELFAYRAPVGLTPRTRRPIYRTRYLARCSCGYETCGDYISTMTRVRAHRRAVGCAL